MATRLINVNLLTWSKSQTCVIIHLTFLLSFLVIGYCRSKQIAKLAVHSYDKEYWICRK